MQETKLDILQPTKLTVQTIVALTKNWSIGRRASSNHNHINSDLRPKDEQREIGDKFKVNLLVI